MILKKNKIYNSVIIITTVITTVIMQVHIQVHIGIHDREGKGYFAYTMYALYDLRQYLPTV